MLISHSSDGDMLQVTLHRHLDIATRAAAVQEIEALIHAHRPRWVTLSVPDGEPAPATLSTALRLHRMCQNLGIALDLTGASAAMQRPFHTNTA
ncbi:hypothetical protein ABZT03_42340 [Streptomyces sp. NPDC005574]|uniref:hypothetical protein n=1 Tax=Streptomyces sp. NPDC005574 TaxID=3156891 RepID=UPI0033A5E4C6